MIVDITEKREKGRNKIVSGCLITIILFIIAIPLLIFFSHFRIFYSFGEKEKEIIRDEFNITLDESATPEKMKLSWGHGDHCYELWLKDIDDPEEFMENCYNGSYAVIENKSDLIEFGEESISALYDYNGSLVADSSYIMYTSEYYAGYNPYYYGYVIAFYKDGDSFKAKVVDEDR
ncbi:hypothetical protein [Ruminococcus albus]|uniref:Uncharacterized protein n=1 Tax=Ruminococcus albus TaxID=1264 RepID=A0A1H7PUH2_RUMAL|nr:hypothetical protein [Ruminococcus albus]SEL39044.1 hypothetical protein SAMN05216469_1259 [Ruminococcus albus]